MCPPDYFSVDYIINPWMAGQEGAPDIEKAHQQWGILRDEIAKYADISIVDPQPDLPDMVFTANAGVVSGNKAIASHFMPHERRPEEAHFKSWFSQNDFKLLGLDEKIGFEGAGDCLFDRGGPWLWTGYGFRTEIEAHSEIASYFNVDVVPLRLVDSRFYHIDTCFCPLEGGFVMYHPPAFDFDSRIAIESRIPPHKRIIVDTEDAGNFACNAVNIDNKIIVNSASSHLKKNLSECGFEVTEVDLSEFLKAGGSAKCLTLKLVDGVFEIME
jgi:N-dimethylarginine dimethylaminohydrolase|tara:strand:+ start:167 stop:979 length:813 start_codon:yes stop_codon:yes gene_type:complete